MYHRLNMYVMKCQHNVREGPHEYNLPALNETIMQTFILTQKILLYR